MKTLWGNGASQNVSFYSKVPNKREWGVVKCKISRGIVNVCVCVCMCMCVWEYVDGGRISGGRGSENG